MPSTSDSEPRRTGVAAFLSPPSCDARSMPGTATLRRPPVADDRYRPAQQRVIDVLGRRPDDTDEIDAEVVAELRHELEERLAPVASQMPPGESLYVGKTPLATFGACPGRWLADLAAPFSWTVPSVRGTVSHKAIELTLNWRGEVEPSRAVDAAITRLIDDDGSSAGRFLRNLSTVELAELRSASVDLVTAFEECFPPLKPRWRPVIDGRNRAELCGGRVVLVGRPDLTLGQAGRGGKVIIDLKTGDRRRHHVDDLRFYALVDALRVGVPARRLATVYLDAGQPVVETVTVGVLEAATERVVRTVQDMVETRWGTLPVRLRTGRHCSWCPARERCTAGLEWARGMELDR